MIKDYPLQLVGKILTTPAGDWPQKHVMSYIDFANGTEEAR
jgi:hypothetical protein